jgi:23S rRNA pseudouridine2605 synthase
MDETTIRLNKYLANVGICSRRDVKQFLKGNEVTVNGIRVKESGKRVNPQTDAIKINGKQLYRPKLVYYLLHKPKGIISTTDDEYGRKNVTSLIPTKERIYPVGRLDKDTTGLIILTNDGTITNLLTHPKYHVYKTYRLTINGRIFPEQLTALQTGVLLTDGITAPAHVAIIKQSASRTLLDITIHEGRNRQVRRMCETVGIDLIDLQRVKFGPISDTKLQPGQYRELTRNEIAALHKTAMEKSE